MKVWQGIVVAGVLGFSAMILIPAEKEARRLRIEDRKAAWRAHWNKVRPRAWHELPFRPSPSIVPEHPAMQLDTS